MPFIAQPRRLRFLPHRPPSERVDSRRPGRCERQGHGGSHAGLRTDWCSRYPAPRVRSPEEVLAKLNTMLVEKQHGGFTTCICLELGPGGAVAIANAGHLPPYWNGKEQSLDHGFPLGLLPQAQYAASVLQLAPRDRLTLCTDGIPEARIPQGELFGFDRTAAVSHLGAEEIARSAQQFGQEDDITVVTLTFALAEVLHA